MWVEPQSRLASAPQIKLQLTLQRPGAPSPISGAVPHSAREDDVYIGKTITKGSIVMMNVCVPVHPILLKSEYIEKRSTLGMRRGIRL